MIYNGEIWCKLSALVAPVLWPIKSVQRNSSPKAQWTERYIYYLGKFCPGTFFSNGRISGTKRDFVNALAPKFSSCPGLSPTLSWKWPRPTLSSSFGLFLEREPFFGVFQVGHFGPFWSKTCPWVFFHWRKKIVSRQAILSVCRDKVWTLSFQPLSGIFTQTVWKHTYLGF